MNAQTSPKKDVPIKKTAARLLAVQALYQNLHNPEPASLLVNEYLSRRVAMEVEGEDGKKEVMATPDGAFFKKIIIGIEKNSDDLNALVQAHLKKDGEEKTVELLLKAVLLCGAWEVVYNQDIDIPIIINDYVEISRGFYEGGEPKLVNAVLDKIAKNTRD